MNGQKIDSYFHYIAGIILFSVLFLPDIEFSANFPAVQLLDLMLPVLCFLIFVKRRSVEWLHYYTFIGLAAAYILVTILINGRWSIFRDYFEIYKFFKFLVVILFFTLTDVKRFLETWIKPFFIGIVVLNIIHFFDLFRFNVILEQVYNGGLNIQYFGIDTLGNLSGKRMVGLIGNPNSNALLFAFFTIYFFPFRFEKKQVFWFALALTMAFMCQSRTFLAVTVLLILGIVVLNLVKWNLKTWMLFLTTVAGCYVIAWGFSSRFFQYDIYGNSMFNGIALESQSAMGRLEAWRFLGKMIVEKPVFGHGPNKDFFYNNGIYSENEYILYTWRYGILGLGMYLLVYLMPLKRLYSKKSIYSKYIVLLVILMMVSAITNNPFTERNILILYAVALGILFSLDKKQRKENETAEDGRVTA